MNKQARSGNARTLLQVHSLRPSLARSSSRRSAPPSWRKCASTSTTSCGIKTRKRFMTRHSLLCACIAQLTPSRASMQDNTEHPRVQGAARDCTGAADGRQLPRCLSPLKYQAPKHGVWFVMVLSFKLSPARQRNEQDASITVNFIVGYARWHKVSLSGQL